MGDDDTLLRRSVNTERALTLPRPRLRGVSHLLAAILAAPTAIAWVLAAPGSVRLAVACFGLGIATMFGCSALLHLKRWDARTYERLFRLDHSGIYVAIGGTGVAVGVLGMPPMPGRLLILAMAVGTIAGIVVEWMPFAPPRGFNQAIYLTLGWLPVLMLPWLWTWSGPLVVGLLAVGGVLYTSGAAIVGLRRPALSPRWFGYHELFHLLVIGAVIAHGTMIAVLVDRAS